MIVEAEENVLFCTDMKMDYKRAKFGSSDKMSDLISNDYRLLLVMSRFGISLGFGDKTVEQVCRESNVDCSTFLTVANFMQEENDRMEDNVQDISVVALTNYLKQSHSYFLDFCLPTIRRKLINAIDCSAKNEVAFLILKFFDEYVGEVRHHMEYENQQVFTYVDMLLHDKYEKNYNIGVFSRRHDQVELKLTELKNIILKYYPERGNNHLLNSVLFDIFSCEQDLAFHNKVEDFLFIPVVRQLEKEKGL